MHTLAETGHSDRALGTVDIRVLGPVEVTVRSRAVAIGGLRASRVLALLAMNCNTIVPHDGIVDALWDDPPSTVRQQVHNVVHGLRRALDTAGGQASVVRTGTGYRLEADGSAVDVLRFQEHVRRARLDTARGEHRVAAEHLRDALAQWRGPALSGLAQGRLARIATLLDDQRLTVAEQLAELDLANGEGARTIRELVPLVAEHPYHEALRAVLIKALHQEGRQAEALALYEQGRRVLVEELGLEPSEVLRAAQQQVLAGGRDEPGPNFLPRDLAEFTGRASEVERLTAQADRAETTAPGIVTITGMAGVGKTTLAVHAGHRLAADYPAGQFYVDLRGFTTSSTSSTAAGTGATTGPLDPGHALELLLRDIGVPAADIPPGLHGRSALWRSRLAGQRALVILDNATGPAQVRPLIPNSPKALVLITSRRGLAALEGSVPLPLGMMPEAEGLRLFSAVAGPLDNAARKAAAAIIEHCEGLPLAIGAAAARLRDRPHWTASDVLDQLRITGCPRSLESISLSVAGLTFLQQQLLSLLSRSARRSFDVRTAAALCDLSLEETVLAMEELFDAGLLQACTRGHYRLHRLVREAARGLAPEEPEPAPYPAEGREGVRWTIKAPRRTHGALVRPLTRRKGPDSLDSTVV